jgi:hypothetical protein
MEVEWDVVVVAVEVVAVPRRRLLPPTSAASSRLALRALTPPPRLEWMSSTGLGMWLLFQAFETGNGLFLGYFVPRLVLNE